ncbi:MAG TPA: hypothetical protein DEP57_08290 [Selenomonas sp.]|nr:hypothetical protein [Selenomonadaceae bacterium]HCB93786.1 hypothetical protein [Selenomonas sp.]
MEVLIIGIVVTVLIWIGCRSILIGQMSNVHSASSADDYLIRDSVDITEQTDTYLYTDVSRRPKPKK